MYQNDPKYIKKLIFNKKFKFLKNMVCTAFLNDVLRIKDFQIINLQLKNIKKALTTYKF